MKLIVAVIALILPLAASAQDAPISQFCPAMLSVFHQIVTRLDVTDQREAFINNSKKILDTKNLRVLMRSECPKMYKGVKTIAYDKPQHASRAWRGAVLEILSGN